VSYLLPNELKNDAATGYMFESGDDKLDGDELGGNVAEEHHE
jgi:hypothetical protein